MSIRLLLLAVILGMSLTPTLQAEDSQDNPTGFRIRAPKIFLGGHLGLNMPRAESDLFGMITRELTLVKSDFRSPSFGFDLGVPFHPHFATVFSFDYARSSPHSESRDFMEENGDPITQATRFSQIPVTVSLRYYPVKFGETVGSYAWVPTRLLPYIGGGVGFLHYNFSQRGSFVDRETLNIFNDDLSSQGTVWTHHVFAGTDFSLSPSVFVNGEARYSLAEAGLSGDFKGFKPIDLAGFKIQAGIYFRF
jgi:opacity protein-like surface antigen